MKKTIRTNLFLFFASIIVCMLTIEGFLRLTTRPANIVNLLPQAPQNQSTPSLPLLELPDSNSVESVFQTSENGVTLRPNTRIRIINHFVSHLDIDFSVNSLGFRGPELGEKQPRDIRVLVLGDSITLADYLPNELTYPALLESFFKQIPPEHLKANRFQFINAGVGTIDLANEFKILQAKKGLVKPDVVLIGMYLNDADRSPYLNLGNAPWLIRKSYLLRRIYQSLKIWEVSRGKAPHAVGQRLDKKALEQFAKVYEIKKENLNQYLRQFPESSEEAFNHHIYGRFWDWGYAWSDEHWEEIRHTMIPLKQYCEKNNLAVAVILFPVSHQVYAPFVKDVPQQNFERLMRDLDIPHLDLLPILRKKFAFDQRPIFFDHCHLTEEGYLFLTPHIAAFLNENIFQSTLTGPAPKE